MQFSKIIRGTWFLPDSEQKVKGRLYSKKSDIYLEVLSPLGKKEVFASQTFDFIHGVTYNQKSITLYKCDESLSAHYDEENSIFIYRIRFVIENGHFTKENFTFDTAEFYPSNFEEWLNIKPFKKVNADDSSSISHKTIPDIIEKVGPDLTLRILFYKNVHTEGLNKIEMSTTASVRMESTVKRTFDEWIETIIHFANFLTLSYTRHCPINFIELSNSEVIEKYSMIIDNEDFGYEEIIKHKVIYKTEKSLEKNSYHIHHFKMIFVYSDISDKFSFIIGKWYEIKNDIRPMLGLLLENIFRKGNFNENNFLNSAHALESFHRRFRNNIAIPKNLYKQKVKDVLQSVSEEHKEWVASRIEFGNEPSLHTRLEEILLEVDGKFIRNTVADKSKFITQFKALTPGDLFYLSRKIDYIVLLLILKEVGISMEVLDDLFCKQLKMGLLFDRWSF
jgi:hypothetical protein